MVVKIRKIRDKVGQFFFLKCSICLLYIPKLLRLSERIFWKEPERVSLFVSRMLLPAFVFFTPQFFLWGGGGLKPPKPPLPTPLHRFTYFHCACSQINFRLIFLGWLTRGLLITSGKVSYCYLYVVIKPSFSFHPIYLSVRCLNYQ